MANALSVRPRRLAETPTSDEVYVVSGSENDLRAAHRLVVLIHGFNNSQAHAESSFESFRGRVGSAIPQHELWGFHWPGDHETDAISLVTYGIRLGYTQRVGQLLAEFLLAQSYESVCIVAHSLGCRVALEAMLAIARISPSRPCVVRDVFLLAAAVPVPLCDASEGRFPRPLLCSQEHVFHSRRDFVLRVLFQPGQRPVGVNEEGPAVGIDGDPELRWTEPWKTKLGHGDYWADPAVNDEILRRMGIVSSRRIPGRGLPENGTDRTAFAVLRRLLPKRKVPRR